MNRIVYTEVLVQTRFSQDRFRIKHSLVLRGIYVPRKDASILSCHEIRCRSYYTNQSEDDLTARTVVIIIPQFSRICNRYDPLAGSLSILLCPVCAAGGMSNIEYAQIRPINHKPVSDLDSGFRMGCG